MAILLRNYQDELVKDVGQALRRSRRVILVLPPGGGKTVIAAFIAQRFASKGDHAFFNCHRQELLQQTSLTFANCGLAHGFIAAGHPMHLAATTQVCSIDTLKNRLKNLKEPKVVLWDECHHIGAAGWAAIMAAWPNAYHIGLTGTPWRLDGTGLGKYFDEMVMGPTPAELIEMGSLSPYVIYAPSSPDMSGVRKQMGDFAKAEAAAKMDKPKLTGDIINHWLKLAKGKRTVGYAVNVAHSLHMAEQFNAAGIPAAHLDGGTLDGERVRTIQQFASGQLEVLFNVGLFGEGFDLSAIAQRPVTIDCAILANPTNSLSKYLQESMRPMRPAPGKVAVILDHAGNCERHGFPDDEREWDLEGRHKRGKTQKDDAPPPPVTCDGCFRQIKRPLPECCPGCGKRLLANTPIPEVAEGELKAVTDEQKKAMRAARKREEAEAKDLQSLVALAVERGYKSPQKWAFNKWSNSAWR
jgi:superfamily II DNA or RNA helicase